MQEYANGDRQALCLGLAALVVRVRTTPQKVQQLFRQADKVWPRAAQPRSLLLGLAGVSHRSSGDA